MILEQQQEVQEEQGKEFLLCLNMIVKNESHIIKDKLTKLLQKIKFDYWVISDTGSTDETKEIITEFFKEVGIPGEIYEDDWVDFSHNRNRALEYAFGKSKYLLVFDADDEICGDFVLPELTRDSYSLQFGSYTRPQIVNNHKRWKYVGVLHEFICSADSRIDDANTEIIKGPYHVTSGRTGNRNLDSNKYLKDAIILEKAYYNAVDAKDEIYNRYGFYCANSYYDCDKYEHAISWYKKTLENGGWAQEKYVSCLKLYNCYNNLDNKEAGFFYLVKSAEYDRERAECYYELIKYYSSSGLHDIAYAYYGVLRDFYKNSYLKDGLNNKLFVDVGISEFHLPYYVVIVCEKMRDYETGIHMYRIIFTKKCKIFDEWYIGNLLYNLQFFTEHVKDEDKTAFYSLFQEYVDFLVANNYPLSDGKHEFMKFYEKYGIKKKEASIATDECLTSKKILIYTGFMNYLWNDTYVSNNAIGGAEKAVAYLARNLPKEYEIIISGDVADEVVGNVKYVNRFKLQSLLDVEKFHTIIVSRYVSFFLLFPRFHCHQLYLCAHDTEFLNNFNGIPVNTIIEENNKYIKGVICLTTWHKLNTIQTHACLKDKVSIINNGILVAGATSNKKLSHNKIKNKFVWTSCSYRGLDVMLKLWDEILEVMPDATLDISSYNAFPCNKKDEEIQMIINRHIDSVKHHGKLNTLQLHDLISKAEYWLYTNTFCETSCITALEMLMHEVVCLYYPLAGLVDTIGEYGIKVNSGNEIQIIMNLSEAKKVEMRINGKKYAMSCSWENRAKEWASVLGLNELNNQRIYDLHNNYTIPRNHINYLNKLKYNFQPKIIYDIGANVLNWTKEAKKVWNGADIIVFDAIKSAEFLYKEHHYKYHIGVLSDTDDKIVKFYENSEHPAGNSYYKEVGHEKSNELYPENKFTEQFSTTLATVVKNNNFPLPDLIKFDVQGCELDIIKGSIDIINHAKYLIVELQIIEYNKGAPLANETIKFLEDNNWELLTKTPFCDNGPDGDYCFKNNRIVNKISNMKMLGLNPTYPIYIVNLKRRKDRRDNMEKQLKLSGIDSYNFVEAVDGKALNASSELFSLFERNDFNCNKGVVGCALSHIHLWNKLINDKENDFYVVLEDDITFCDNFKKYLGDVCKLFVEKKLEHLALGEYNTSKVFPTDNFKIDVYSKDLYKEYHTTFAYIISKNAAKKNINYINSCSIKCASDNPQAFGYTLNYSALNVNLVHCQIINEYGTDIQSNNIDDFFEFTTSNDKQLKILTVSFCDWWEKEYSGGCFDLNNNFFTNLLREYGNNYEIKIINPFENPDILFYSIFGVSHKNYTAGRKIFFSGEPYPQRDDADFNLTFDENSFDNTRVPLWLCYFDKLLIEECKKRRNNQNMIPNREKFCSFIAGGPGLTNNRKEFVEKLSKYKQVDCGGSYLNNIGYNIPIGLNCSGKIEHNNNYKFAMAFESAMYPGYVTEKICDVFKSNCVPIYWGTKDVVKDYNPKTFINANDFENFDELVDYIIKVDNDEELYKSFFEEQIITPQWFDILLNDQNKTFFKNLADKIIGKTQNLLNNLNDLSSKNEEKYYAGNKIDEFLSTYIFKGYKNGYFIDIGANDGLTINNTLYFEKYYNWTGINVEPLDEPYNKLILNRGNCINLKLAIDNVDGEAEFIYNTGYTEMISGLKKPYDPRHFNRLTRELNQHGGTSTVKIIKTKTVKTILEENKIKHINYLSIDVEGGEKNVLESINFHDVFIDVISFEDNFSDTTLNVIKFMEANNFILVGRFGDIIMIHKDSNFIDGLDYKKIMSLTNEEFNCFGMMPNKELYFDIIDSNSKNIDNLQSTEHLSLSSTTFKIGFYDNGLSERGTTTALYSYADYAEKYFKCKSIIFYNKHHHANNNEVINRFSNRFDIYRVENFDEIDRIISDKNIKYFYNTCGGKRNCTELVKNCKNLIHAVFDIEPFGDKYSAISDYIVKKSKYPDIDAIPYMIDLPIHNDNMRHELNLPDNAFVIGRIGGYEQFDIKEAHTGIINFLNNANNTTTYFVFVNTAKFYEHPQIIYLDKIVDPYLKVKYINTCNCMIHARSDGETFGLAIAEFSSFNKPIVTCRSDKDNCHLDILGEKAIIFDSETSLINILKDIKNIVNSRDDWNAYKEYTPDKVMKKFMNVFMPEINNSSDNITFDNINNINYIDMKSKAPHFHNTKELVIVSAFLDINREKWSTAYKRTTRDYILSFSNYFNYNTKMLVFIDDKYIEELKEIYNNSLHNNTIFIPINNDWMTKHIHAWQLLDNSNDIMQSDEYINLVKDRIACGNPENIYADYNAINHSKIDFICYAINNNLINRDDFICWSDFGYFNSILHNNPSEYPINHLDITKFNPNKLSFCLRNKLDNKDKDTIHTLVNAPERFTGSFFAGSATLMIKLQELYHISLKELYNNNISDDDQHIYLRCFLKEPNIFDLYLDSCQWPKGLCYFEKLPDKTNTTEGIEEIIKNFLENKKYENKTELCDIMNSFGSDKGNGWHNYTTLYYEILKSRRNDELNIFELGLGTNNIHVPSNMGIDGKPRASLYGWNKFFKNSKVFGADIDRDILIYTQDIKTYYCDQLNPKIINEMYNNSDLINIYFDLIVEDGLHTFDGHMIFMQNSLNKLARGGIYIIEDICKDYINNFTEELLNELKINNNLSYIGIVDLPNKKNKTDNIVLIAQKKNIMDREYAIDYIRV